MHHSPDGFSWGYAGSGPSELSRCILWDYLGEEPHPACYQAFKASVVAHWPQDGDWKIDGVQIAAWLHDWVRGGIGRFTTVAAYEKSLLA